MTDDRIALVELLQKSRDGDLLQILMEADVEGLIGTGRHERSADRPTISTGIASAVSTPGWVRSS